MGLIYLDHNATSPMNAEVRTYMQALVAESPANPSSLHGPGKKARAVIEDARLEIASFVGAKPSEITFTSGGTEANAGLLNSVVSTTRHDPPHVVTVATEHHAVLQPLNEMSAAHRIRLTVLGVNDDGLVDLEALDEALSDAQILAMMWANNETGVRHPLEEVARLVKTHGVHWHCDAIAAASWESIALYEGWQTTISSLSISAQKLAGPQGAGACFMRRGLAFQPLIYGGNQESGRRAGTENVAAIGGFAEAARQHKARRDAGLAKQARVQRDNLQNAIIQRWPNSRINGAAVERLPNTLSVCLRDSSNWMDGEWLLLSLAEQHVAVSTGAACASGLNRPSHVLLAMGLDPLCAQSSLRFSLGPDTTGEDIDGAIKALADVVSTEGKQS